MSLKQEPPAVGDQVLVTSVQPHAPGIVRFSGTTEFAAGVWLGIELEGPNGKNNGWVKGTQYFSCDDAHGLFVRATAVTVVAKGESKDSAVVSEAVPLIENEEVKRAASPPPAAKKPSSVSRTSTSNGAAAPRASKLITGSSDSGTSNSQRLAVQQQLAEGIEDHDADKIRSAFNSGAATLGLPRKDLDVGQLILNQIEKDSICSRIENIRRVVVGLTETVQKAEVRAEAMEQTMAAMLLSKHPNSPSTTSSVFDQDVWTQQVKEQLEQRVCGQLQKVVNQSIHSAVEQVTRQLASAISTVTQVTHSVLEISNDSNCARGTAGDQQSSEGRLEGIRMKARHTLLGSMNNGTLCEGVAGDQKGIDGRLEAIRKQARQTLVSSSQNGSLFEGIKTTPPAQGVDSRLEAIRERTRQGLEKSYQDGAIVDRLQKGKDGDTQPNGQMSSGSSDDARLQSIRARAQESLVTSLKDGALGGALTSVLSAEGRPGRGTSSTDDERRESIRSRARDSLLKSCEEGTLATACKTAAAHKGSLPADDARRESVRLRAQNALMQSVQEGTLADGLKACRQSAVNAPSAGGRLQAIGEDEPSANASAVGAPSSDDARLESIRTRARSTLVTKNRNGSLAIDLARGKALKEIAP